MADNEHGYFWNNNEGERFATQYVPPVPEPEEEEENGMD